MKTFTLRTDGARFGTCAGALLYLLLAGNCSGGRAPATGQASGNPTAPTPTAAPAPTPAPTPVPAPTLDPPPVLSVTIVDLSGTYDPIARRLGTLNCNFVFPTDPNDRWCFNAFGATLGSKQSPSYDYKVAAGTIVRAAAAGIVRRLEAETNPLYPGEFEVETRSSQNGTYLVIYDHVRNLRVALGASVEPGTELGIAGIHTSNRDVYGRVELQINRVTNAATGQSESVCPRGFGTTAFSQAHDAALAAHNSANPAFASSSVCLTDVVRP